MVTAPGEEGVKQNLVTVDPKSGNIVAANLTGDTVVFNSYSDVRGCNPTKSGKVNFQVKIAGNVAAVLDANMVSKYRIEEKVGSKRKLEEVEDLDSLYSEIALQREQCALLLRDDTPPSIAEV